MKIYIKYISIVIVIGLLISCSQQQKKQNKAEDKGLKELADFPIGTAISLFSLGRDSIKDSLQIKNFNSITAENSMKMFMISRDSGKYNFEAPDKLLKYAQENNQRLFGHALIWHSGTPKWIEELAVKDSVALDSLMKDYITTYVGRYKGKVAAWDVVNEAMNTAGGEYRETVWYNALGKDYIAKAFTYAHEADPDADLFYNDFNIERDTAKLNGTLRMIKDLKSQNIPITGIGFQMHTRMDVPDSLIAYTLRKAADTGLKIHLSEVDIIFNKHDDTQGGGEQIYSELTEEMKQQQAEKYKNLVLMYRTIVPKEQQFGITFWGFSDKYTWINGFFNLKVWPSIYDKDLKPKPAFYGFAEGLTQEIK
jgi:endo-1,4-beta-xylanase